MSSAITATTPEQYQDDDLFDLDDESMFSLLMALNRRSALRHDGGYRAELLEDTPV